MTAPSGRATAVVIGAGIAGLAAAKVLADRFAQVFIVDRDELPDHSGPRRGVPQGQHSHVLLVAGQRSLGEIFPGLHETLAQAGAVVFDSGRDLHLFRLGQSWQPVVSGMPFVSLTRPLLEYIIRRQVSALSQVSIRSGTAVSGLTGADGQVTGVVLDDGTRLAADLVVDATGRSSRSDRWLSALGYPTPDVEEVKVSVGYVSRLYRRTPGDLTVSAAFVQPTPPAEKRIGAVLLVEDDQWLVSVGGWHGEYPAADEEGFVKHAESLPDPIVAELIKKAEPLTELVAYHFPSNRRRLFDQLTDVPGGYVAIGDAISSFNPLYGQGMTVAAQEAQALGQILDQHGPATADAVRHFYQQAAQITFIPWQSAIGGDFDYPETAGARPAAAELFGRFSEQVQRAAQIDGEVRKVILAVQHLLSPPMALWNPALVARIARSAPHPSEGAEPEYGLGGHGRPLWTEADADAERIRTALRTAGFAEFTDTQGGFAVEGGEPILIAGLDGRAAEYVEVIKEAGYDVTPDPGDQLLLRAKRR